MTSRTSTTVAGLYLTRICSYLASSLRLAQKVTQRLPKQEFGPGQIGDQQQQGRIMQTGRANFN